MTGETHTYPYVSPGPMKLPPGSLEPVEELPGDSEFEDDGSQDVDSCSEIPLSDIEEDGEEEGFLRERDAVFEKIKESLSKTQRSDSDLSAISSVSDSSDGPHVQISEHYTSVPYGIQPKATYEHSSIHGDIMGVAYNNRMRQFVILDSKGMTTWKRDQVDPRVRRALQYPKYEYRLIVNIVYAPKYNCYFALGKDFALKVLNRDFEETCSVSSDLRSVLFMLFNPVKDELITGGVGGIKFWQFKQKAGQAFQELKPLANYKLEFLYALPNVGGSWVKRVDLDHYLQHLYCCSDTDLHVYDLHGKLLFKFERAHSMSITGCCFSPSAKVLVTSSVDSEVKVWSLTGGLVHTFRGHSRAVTSLVLHPDTSSILLTSSLDGSFRMWSLDTMDQLYMLVVSTDGVLWMGLTDDKALYICTCRNITLWNLNNFYSFWGLARNQVSQLSLASCKEKTTRIVAVGEDSSVRIFCRSNQKNITTVLPPPDISALQSVLSVCYSREKNASFLLVTNKEIWVYTTRTDPACRIAVWDVYELQLPYISGDTSNLPPGVIIQPPSTTVGAHRATENGHGNEVVCNCHSLCILNSTAMMMTDEGLCCPIRHTYLLLGLEDGRILFMDPVIRGQKYMEFKACKDAIQDLKHDVASGCLITLCKLKELVIIQIWGLPTLDAMYEVYTAPDITCYARLGMSFLSGHKSGHLNFHFLEPIEDVGVYTSAKQEPNAEDIIDTSRRPEHSSTLVAMDTSATLRIFVTCSYDGAIKIWDENKFLMTEVMLEESLSAACFLNDMGDLLVGFKNHIFYVDHGRLCPHLKPPEVEMETSDQESDVYEDPRVLYELIEENPEPITKESYLVPYPNIEFDKDFLEGITKIEQHKAAISSEESGSESETDVSLAPSSIYLSPPESPDSLSRIDLTLGSDYSKYDLKQQMKYTLEYIFKREPSRKPSKIVTIETPGQSDLEDHEADMEVEKFSLPMFGDSPGPSPSVTPPTRPSSPRQINVRTKSEVPDIVIESDEEMEEPAQESPFVPVEPEAVTPQQEMSSLGVYPEGEPQSRSYGIKGKVDVKGLMKKRRVTSGRAPSLTRRSSADHTHDDHDHDHGHDDNRAARKQLQKKQQLQERKMPPHLDRNKLLELPPNPPSMLTKKNSLPRDRKNLEIQLLHHPEYRRESKDSSHEQDLANVKNETVHIDMEQAQEEMWKAEANLQGTQLAIPPQRDPNKARLSDGPIKEPRNIRNRNRTPMFGDKGVVDTHILGVGATPTAELEDDREDNGRIPDRLKIEVNMVPDLTVIPTGDTRGTGTEVDQTENADQDTTDHVTDLDANTPETQMQREKRLRLKVNSELFQEGEKDKKGVPKAFVRKSKLNIYLPQADRDSISTKSSYRGTPDSGIDDFQSLSGGQTPTVPLSKRSEYQEQETDELLQQELAAKKDESLLTEDDKAKAVRRPASSFTGLRRGHLEGERLKAERPHTAHVRFKAEDLQAAFEEAFENYRSLPGTPKIVSAEKLYQNDGTSFEDNWQERVIERHILLRMQREIRAQSAAKRREAFEITQQEKRNQQYTRSWDSAVGFSRSESSISAVKSANTSMSVPLSLGRSSVPPPSREKQRPKTAHPTLQKPPQPSKSELSLEKAFRYRLSRDPPFSARSATSSRSSSAPSVQDFSPHWIDPRNPDAWRPKSSRSIPSKCQRYVLISKPKDVNQAPVPSPLEEQLLIERFPKMGARVLQTMPEPVPKVKKSYSMEYSPFVYQRFV